MTIEAARWMALAAQGFDRPRRARKVTARDLSEVIRRLGLLQIDYVNVLVPACPFTASVMGELTRRLPVLNFQRFLPFFASNAMR